MSPSSRDRDPDAGRHEHLVGADHQRLGEDGDEPPGDRRHRLRTRQVRAEQHELVAAEAGEQVAGSQRVPQPLRDGHEQVVTRGVTEAVVDQLEVVEVDEEHGRLPSAGVVVGGKMSGDALAEAGPVEQPGHHVVRGLVAETVAERLPLGDVLELSDREHRTAVVVLHRRHRQRDPHRLAVGAQRAGSRCGSRRWRRRRSACRSAPTACASSGCVISTRRTPSREPRSR